MAEEVPVEAPAEDPQDEFAIRGQPQNLEFDLQSTLTRHNIPLKVQEQFLKSHKPEPVKDTHAEDARLNKSVEPPVEPLVEPVAAAVESPVDETTPVETVEPTAEPAAPAPEEEKFTKQIDELTGQVKKIEAERNQFQSEAATLKTQLQGVEPIIVAPTPANPLSFVQNLQQLEEQKQGWTIVKNWAITNFEGIEDLDDPSKNISAKDVRAKFIEADEKLSAVESRRTQLVEEAEFNEKARAHFPTVMDRGTSEHAFAVQTFKEFPGLAAHPARYYIIGVLLHGYKDLLQKHGKNGKSDIPAQILAPKPPVAPAVPNRPSRVVAAPAGKKLEEAKAQVIKSRGDPKVAAQMLREGWDRTGRFTNKKKVLV